MLSYVLKTVDYYNIADSRVDRNNYLLCTIHNNTTLNKY